MHLTELMYSNSVGAWCVCVCVWGLEGNGRDSGGLQKLCGPLKMMRLPGAALKRGASWTLCCTCLGHLWTRVHILSVESPSLSWPCPLTGERERISVATVCGPGIMAAAPFPDLRLFSWGNNSAQMARSQVGGPQGWPEYMAP